MTTKEFSDAFDIMLNSYGDFSGTLAFDEYEKSLFLTQAQEQLVIELYTGRNNKGGSFEKTEEMRASLKSLIKTSPCNNIENLKGISKYSKFFTLPKDILFITYESATLDDTTAGCKNGSEILIVPTTQDEFNTVMENPFRQASERRALRLDYGTTDDGTNVVEIVTKYNIKDYTIRYLSKPTPIILANLNSSSIDDKLDSLSIDDKTKITECTLNSVLHKPILERAVLLALSSRSIQNKSNV